MIYTILCVIVCLRVCLGLLSAVGGCMQFKGGALSNLDFLSIFLVSCKKIGVPWMSFFLSFLHEYMVGHISWIELCFKHKLTQDILLPVGMNLFSGRSHATQTQWVGELKFMKLFFGKFTARVSREVVMIAVTWARFFFFFFFYYHFIFRSNRDCYKIKVSWKLEYHEKQVIK